MIAALLERVERGELRRLIVNLPPRHGKSLLCSSIFPAWYLGRHPRHNVIMATHSAELSERNSRGARALVQDNRWPFDSRLSGDSSSASRWNLDKGGGVFACGVGGSVTGRGANVLILDDAQHDSGTDSERESAWRWYQEIIVPRLEPGATIVAIGTRFAEDDIFGRLLDGPDADTWTVLRLPAFAAEENDPLGRAPLEALWPERISADELQARKRSMSPRWFAAQFEQDPTPATGTICKAEWIQYAQTPTEFSKVVVGIDTASKTDQRHDFSAVVKIGISRNAFHVISAEHFKAEFPQLIRRVAALGEEYPKPSTIYIEDSANAHALIQALKQETRLPIVGVPPKGSKISRFEATTGLFEARKVFLAKDLSLDLERELLGFPGAKHDDLVDAFTLALAQLSVAKKQWFFTFGGPGPHPYWLSETEHSPEVEETVPSLSDIGAVIGRLGL